MSDSGAAVTTSPQIPAASFPIGPPLGQIQFVNPQTGYLSQAGYQLMTTWWASIQNQGGIKPQADGNSEDITTIFDMHGDGTLSADGVLTVVSSEGRDFVESAFEEPTLTFEATVQFEVTGSPWTQAGTIALVTKVYDTATLGALSPDDGDRAFVSDSNVTAAGNFGAAYTGGGANHVPVYYDAGTTTWRIG